MPSALLSDVWYTLIYYRKAERERVEFARRQTWLRALTEAGLSPARAAFVITRLENEGRAAERRGRTPPLADRIREVGRTAGVKLDASGLVEELDRIVRERPPRIAAGARAALRAVRERGCRVGIVSNVVFESAAGARRVLDQLHLSTLCDAIVLSADDGVAKPDPRPFFRCLRQLGVAPSRAWYVGDMPTDVSGAAAAGMRPVRFVGLAALRPDSSSSTLKVRPASVLRRWSDLPRLLFGSGRVD